MAQIRISGAGCCLLDYLYTGIDFNNPSFQKYLSRTDGDGGFSPGKLVFTDDFERFSRRKFTNLLPELTGGRASDKHNLGGPAIVAMIHAAQMLAEQAEVRFYGALGNDNTGRTILSIIRQTPVKPARIISSEKDSPYTYVLSDPNYNNGYGERTFINNIGAAWDILPRHLDEEFYHSDIVVFGGTALVPNLHDNLPAMLRRAKDHHCITVVNTVYDFRNEKKNAGKAWQLGNGEGSYPHTDLLIMDNEEAQRISGTASVQSAMDFFIAQHVASFIITNGPDPVWLYADGRIFSSDGPMQMPVSEDIVRMVRSGTIKGGDTTGCGDNFAGGVIASMAEQLRKKERRALSLPQACAWGMVAGGYTCFYPGGTYLEKQAGEKYRLLHPLYHEYINQISGIIRISDR
jgi:sugar/nucleoside kinase (ribokinase family)